MQPTFEKSKQKVFKITRHTITVVQKTTIEKKDKGDLETEKKVSNILKLA